LRHARRPAQPAEMKNAPVGHATGFSGTADKTLAGREPLPQHVTTSKKEATARPAMRSKRSLNGPYRRRNLVGTAVVEGSPRGTPKITFPGSSSSPSAA
jgi:hypothetical protein